ncbi:hypothetical protein SAMN05216474_2196 [Lishizhenia tianjinensis]|uniref:Uncharacterized protein n=1 Tax=Lishizhenia tianjinensis TaxID=477690 RepID=A0A1I7AL82_9FLAO|nr:hypothetical protein [Lishizhenia tianjinensis]SFT75660.1 hypothetical protein SAMN05216474_2196 [Lishizhenia tianjinensis]
MNYKNLHISIPEPCHEDWKEMIPTDKGKFCSSCAKTVIDFTNSTPEEIYQHLQKHPQTCGRIKTYHPSSLTPTPLKQLARFAAALFLVFGMSLFFYSCKMESPAADLLTLTEQEVNVHDTLTLLQDQKLDTSHYIRNFSLLDSNLSQEFSSIQSTASITKERAVELSEPYNYLEDENFILGSFIFEGEITIPHLESENSTPNHSPQITSPYIKTQYLEDSIVIVDFIGLPLEPYEKSVYTAKIEIYKNWTNLIYKQDHLIKLPLSQTQLHTTPLSPGDYHVVISIGKRTVHTSFRVNENL